MKKIIAILLSAVAALCVLSCNEADKLNYNKEVILVTGTDYSPLASMVVEATFPVPYHFSVSATGPVKNTTTVTVSYDPAAVETYNSANGTKFEAVPQDAIEFESTTATIEAGKVASENITVKLLNADFVQTGVVYVIPVSITGADGDIPVLEASKSLLIRLKTSLNYYSANITQANSSCEYHFDDEHHLEMDNWTFEIKIYPTDLKTSAAEQICRVCAWKGTGQVLLRINENGTPWKTMHIVTPNSKFYTSEDMLFEVNKWHMMTVTCDGNTIVAYINGEQAGVNAAANEKIVFSKFELGMAYGNYSSSQLYKGRLAEIRVWDRALSKSEINDGLCSIPADREGLRAYWRVDEGSGGVFHDATGNGFDMDFTNGKREPNDNQYSNYNGGRYIGWVKDNNNICAM